jgi:ABC-2 type transport system permease protein
VNLLSAELRRLFARRFTRLMLILILLVMAAVAAGIGWQSHKHDAAALRAAQQRVEQYRQDNLVQQQQCEAQQANPPADGVKNFPPDFDCAQIGQWLPTADDLLPYQYDFRKDTPRLVMVLGGLLALLGFAVGASFVGAEWNSGGMMNLLLWRPRRVPTLAGKLAALLTGLTLTSVLYAGAWIGALWTVANVRGSTARMTPGVWRSLALDNGRAVALGLCAACIGFAVASLGRHTATALGAAVGYLVVFEIGLRIVLGIAGVARPERFFVSNYMGAWLMKAQWHDDYNFCNAHPNQACEPPHWAIHLNQGLLVLGVAVLLTAGAAFWSMRRRDIT